MAVPAKSYVDVTEDNYLLLGLLDALKDLRKIPDVNIEAAITIMRDRITKLEESQIKMIIDFALHYPPRVRALLGAVLETAGERSDLQELRDSLNPFTSFKMGITPDKLITAPKWRIQ